MKEKLESKGLIKKKPEVTDISLKMEEKRIKKEMEMMKLK